MPAYTYRCDNCGVRFDRQQKFNDRPLSRCPECGKNALHRVYRPVGVVFKGSGFYVTDNRSSASNQASSSGKSSTDRKSESQTKSTSADSKKSSEK